MRTCRGHLSPGRASPQLKFPFVAITHAVSRLVGRLLEDFEAWAKRDLSELKVRYIFLDGWYPRVRIGKKRVLAR